MTLTQPYSSHVIGSNMPSYEVAYHRLSIVRQTLRCLLNVPSRMCLDMNIPWLQEREAERL